jgi:hypothetical protein
LYVWTTSHLEEPDPATTSLMFYGQNKKVHDVALGWNFGLATCAEQPTNT